MWGEEMMPISILYMIFIFYAIPIIALFDYLIFNKYADMKCPHCKNIIKAKPYAWYVATFLEVVIFITGYFLGYYISIGLM